MSEIKNRKFLNRLYSLLITSKWPEKILQMIFVVIFAIYSFTQKRLCQWNGRKCSIKKGFNEDGSLSIS